MTKLLTVLYRGITYPARLIVKAAYRYDKDFYETFDFGLERDVLSELIWATAGWVVLFSVLSMLFTPVFILNLSLASSEILSVIGGYGFTMWLVFLYCFVPDIIKWFHKVLTKA